MSAELWQGTPVFTAGQYMSAGQVNALAQAANLIYDRATGPACPFSGSYGNATYAVRHRSNLLEWRYELNGAAHLAINGAKVAATEQTGSAGVIRSGTADITALGLAVGGFYELAFVVASGSATLWLARETAADSAPTLAASFLDGTTPTAAQWNALSAYLDLLHAETAQPRPPFVAGHGDIGPGGGTVRIWRGSLVHRTNSLAYRIAARAPWNPCDGGGRWLTARVYVAREGYGWHAALAVTATARNAEQEIFEGVADLSGAGLAFGETYRLAVDITSCPCWDTAGKKAEVTFLAEIADASPTVTGWTPPPKLAYPAYLAGVDALAADLPAVRAHYGAAPHNYPVRQYPPTLLIPAYTAIRQHRWLHYRCASADDQPALTYTAGGAGRSVSLEAAADWRVLDLGAQEGLYPGTRYSVRGVEYMIEDTDA